MKFHREGKTIMLSVFLTFTAIVIGLYFLLEDYPVIFGILTIAFVIMYFLVVQFFRVPTRNTVAAANDIISPCDGKVVVIEEVHESEYFKDKRIQVSIFMSPLNVHVNYAPISGPVAYQKYHEGLYLVAWNPKSSTENERTTVVATHKSGKQVLFRQIAGAVARRIICYAKANDTVQIGKEFGFIKFGSRIDLLLPIGTEINVKIGDKVTGAESLIGKL